MGKCPYEENIKDNCIGAEIPNKLYYAWHEGYEAHKLELANQSVMVALLVKELEVEITKVKKLEAELKTKKDTGGGLYSI